MGYIILHISVCPTLQYLHYVYNCLTLLGLLLLIVTMSVKCRMVPGLQRRRWREIRQ